MNKRPLLSIIIPNWNGLRFLPACLNAIERQTLPDLEVIVVDNASKDDSVSYLREHHPNVRVVELPMNRGFTGACNAGIAIAQGTYIALLNNDTEVDAGWAAAVVSAFERYPHIGSVASRMLLFDQRDRIHTAGDFFTTDGQAGNRGVWQPDGASFRRETEVFSACGGSSVYRAEALREVGLLDDDFFFLLEDVDLGWRLQLAGWRCLYTPDAVVYHHLSATGGGVTASFYNGRNSILLLAKNVPNELWIRHGRAIVRRQIQNAAEALKAWRGEAARARLRGMIVGLISAPLQLRKRQQIQRRRAVSADVIESLLTPPAP